MKTLLLILLLVVTVSAQNSGADVGLNVTYDKFRDESAVRLTESLMPDRPGYVLFSVVAVIKSKDIEHRRPKTISLVLESYTDEWYFLKTDNTLRVIQDGKRYEVGRFKRVNSDTAPSGVFEVLVLEVPFAVVERMSRASKLEIQVGKYESEITPPAIRNIKRWATWFAKVPIAK